MFGIGDKAMQKMFEPMVKKAIASGDIQKKIAEMLPQLVEQLKDQIRENSGTEYEGEFGLFIYNVGTGENMDTHLVAVPVSSDGVDFQNPIYKAEIGQMIANADLKQLTEKL